MELRALAERILYGTTLEDKLAAAEAITDDKPGLAPDTPACPGRPVALRFKPCAAGKSEFPGLHRLETASERGKLLHFFGNHELLATELMALVLLKFPEAPAPFRKGVLRTLREEQEHTRLYIERMKDCGVEFGDFPVSGYFWRCVSPMEHPIDYVAGLCLTFEQANLDFSRQFSQRFADIGDMPSSKLLEKIYRDEIAHVAYGLKWFRRWKNPAESDWTAFCQTLKFPLSPQRAKGFALNIAGRRAAGLDSHFIAELNVYSQSKGRTPSVFLFNPFTEGILAQGKSFNPTRHQAAFAFDLRNLPQFLCRQDDLVLTARKPSVGFLSRIKQAGFPLPEFVELPRHFGLQSSSLQAPSEKSDGVKNAIPGLLPVATRKLGNLRPWAWGPDSVELLRPLFASVTGEKPADEHRFNDGIRALYTKSWSAAFLRKLVNSMTVPDGDSAGWRPPSGLLCTEKEIGVTVSSMDEAQEAIAAIRGTGRHSIVVKRTFGMAGGSAIRLLEPRLLDSQLRWMRNNLDAGQQLVIEPWLERIRDFSVQLEMTGDGLKLRGFTGLINDGRGQFVANFAERHHHQRIPSQIISAFAMAADISGLLLKFYREIFARLEPELRAARFTGPIGIDAFAYRDPDGAVRLKPIVEINPRYTMGRVLVELMRQTCQNSAGVFRLMTATGLRAEGFESFSGYARAMEVKYPLKMEGQPARIREGALCLNDPSEAEVCLAVFQVGRSLEALIEPFAQRFI